jgi:membrane-bound lytic murein transglycosylase D
MKNRPFLFLSLLFLLFSSACGTLSGAGAPAASAPQADAVPSVSGVPASAEGAPWLPVSVAVDVPTATAQDVGSDDGDDEDSGGGDLDHALELVESAQDSWTAGDGDQAIESLDEAYAELLKVPVDSGDKEEQQQKDDLRFMISKRLMEIYASRLTAAKGTQREIPLTINDHVEREIALFQTQERDYFLESYRRSGRYRETMAKAFRDAGLPEDLAWLPLIESGFKVRAMSRARALGLWQFIPSTGYKFGLKRNASIDERLDPAKSTAAAIAYLKELHQMFGDWATVLAAYNCGEGSVLRVIRSQKVDYLDNFWDLYGRLPRETARYYPRFLATLAIVKDPAKYGFTLDELDQPVSFETVTIERPVSLKKLAEKSDCDADDLANLNPELRYQATPETPYQLKVPVGKASAIIASIDNLPKWSPPRPSYVVHRVRRGETLSTIAVRYRTSVQRIREANNLRSSRFIRAGQRLRIPLTSAS